MEKIIVRERIIGCGRATSAYILLSRGKDYKSTESFLKVHDINKALEKIFCEEISCNSLINSSLYQSYNMALESQEDNENFKIMYKFDDQFAVHLTGNIYLYHLLSKKEVYSQLVPWFYADSNKYIGDTWWEEDEEILGNLKCLSVVEFMKKYKGY